MKKRAVLLYVQLADTKRSLDFVVVLRSTTRLSFSFRALRPHLDTFHTSLKQIKQTQQNNVLLKGFNWLFIRLLIKDPAPQANAHAALWKTLACVSWSPAAFAVRGGKKYTSSLSVILFLLAAFRGSDHFDEYPRRLRPQSLCREVTL